MTIDPIEAGALEACDEFLDRLDDLEGREDRKKTRKADQAALETLATRGITDDERNRLRKSPARLRCSRSTTDYTAKLAVYLQGADQSGTAWGLLAFTIVEHQYAVTGFYFDDSADVAWALRCWESVRHDGDLH